MTHSFEQFAPAKVISADAHKKVSIWSPEVLELQTMSFVEAVRAARRKADEQTFAETFLRKHAAADASFEISPFSRRARVTKAPEPEPDEDLNAEPEEPPGPEPEYDLAFVETTPPAVPVHELCDEAHADGFARGFAEAEAIGLRAAAELASRMAPITEKFAAELAARESGIAEQLLTLAARLAKQMLRAELTLNPQALLPAVREAVAMISESATRVCVHVHPDDLPLVRNDLAGESDRLTLAPDMAMLRGGCRISSSQGDIDLSLARRIQTALGALGLKDEALPPGHDLMLDDTPLV